MRLLFVLIFAATALQVVLIARSRSAEGRLDGSGRRADLETLCRQSLGCRGCEPSLEDVTRDGLGEQETWRLAGCGRTLLVQASCGGFMRHTCAWSHEGAQVLTHPD